MMLSLLLRRRLRSRLAAPGHNPRFVSRPHAVVLPPSHPSIRHRPKLPPYAAEAVLDQVVESDAVVPSIWRFEVGNALQMAIRRQRITDIFRDNALARLLAMPITVDSQTDAHVGTTALHLATRFRLTLYDAAYVELAQRRGLPLATLDQEMRAAARALTVPLLGA